VCVDAGVMLTLASWSRNLRPVLEMVEAVYRGTAGHLPPVSKDRLTQRTGHFTAGMHFSLMNRERSSAGMA
jgi:hypothetical protein